MKDKETILPITIGQNLKYWLSDNNTKLHMEVDLSKESGLTVDRKNVKVAIANWRRISMMEGGELKESDMKMQLLILRPATDEDIRLAEEIEGLGYD